MKNLASKFLGCAPQIITLTLLGAIAAGNAFGSGTVVAWGDNSWGQATTPEGLSGVVSIAAGFYHNLALMLDSTVVAWGDNYSGQTDVPAGLTNVMAIAAGYDHNLALKTDGTVVAWGANDNGQATPPAGLTGVVAISASYKFSLALKSDGSIVSWGGTNDYGRAIPDGLSGVVAIAAGAYHNLVLKSDGTVVGWGYNDYGQATPPAGLTGVVAIAAGHLHSLALKNDGTIVGWGCLDDIPPAGLTGVVAIAAGDGHSLALKNDGTVVCWGNSLSGWLGLLSPPTGLSNVVAIAAGSNHNLVLVNYTGAPVITQPVSQTVSIGDTVSFTGFARGSDPLSYQWLFNDTNVIVGATSASLTLTNVQPSQAGNYSILVTNAYGAVTSSDAVLTVVTGPPLITSQPANQTIFAGLSATFSAVAIGPRPLNYQWLFNDTNVIEGATTGTLTLTNVQPSQAGNYSVLVTNAYGAVTSSNAVLTVVVGNPPIITSQPANQMVVVGNTATFSVGIVGSQPMYYQWVFNDINLIVGATSASLTLTNVQPGQAGNYSVAITNAYGAVISSNAVLTVMPAPPPGITNTSANTSPLTVNIVGSGQVQPAKLIGTNLTIGKNYTLTATPTAGGYSLFSNWLSEVSGVTSVATNMPKLAFTMQSNLTLTANFVTNSFIGAAGTYYGLFSDTNNGVSQQSAGFFKLATTKKQKFSGQFRLDGDVVRFGGSFDLSGVGTTTVSRNGKSPLSVTVQLALDGSDRVGGAVSSGDATNGWSSTLQGDRAVYSTANPAANYLGRYTMLLPPDTNAAVAPGGNGYGLINVKANGSAAISGLLGDKRTLVPMAASVSKNGDYPLYAPAGNGSIIGWMSFSNTPARILAGNLVWIKNSGPDGYCYDTGFTNEIGLVGSGYTAPGTGQRGIFITNGVVQLEEGNLPGPVTNLLAISDANSITVVTTNVPMKKPTFTKGSGLMKGKFKHPANPGVWTDMVGVYLQNQNYVGGLFKGTNQTGPLKLESAP